MKHTATLLLLVLTIFGMSVPAIAQSTVVIDPCPVSTNGSIWDGIVKAESFVTNNGATAADFGWERMSVNIPEGWTTSVCDPNQCYAPFADAPLNPSNDLISFTVASGATIGGTTGTEQFYIQFIANGIPGVGEVELRVYEDGNEGNSTTCTFTADLVATNVEEVNYEDAITMYPNPARDVMFLSAPAEANVAFVELINVVGSRIDRIQVAGGITRAEIDLRDLKEGIYFARILDSENKILASRRFSKVN